MCRGRICPERGSSRAMVGLSYVRIETLPRACLFLVGRLSHRNASFPWWVALHAGIFPQEVSAPTQLSQMFVRVRLMYGVWCKILNPLMIM